LLLKNRQIEIDHIVVAAPDLDAAKQEFFDATGVMPADGGPHPGGGTRNALVSFGDGCYLELIAPDPQQELEGTNGQRFAALATSELLHWAVRSSNLAQLATRFTAAGLTPGAVRDMARVAPSGERLQWQLMGVRDRDLAGLMPFFIDWQNTPHPSHAAPLVGSLARVQLGFPVGSHAAELLLELLDGLVETRREPGLLVVYESPAGVQTLEAIKPSGFGF